MNFFLCRPPAQNVSPHGFRRQSSLELSCWPAWLLRRLRPRLQPAPGQLKFGCSATHSTLRYTVIAPEHRSSGSQIGAAALTSSCWRKLDRGENINLPALVEPSSSSPHLPSRPRSTHPGRPRSGALPPRPRCLVPTPRARLGTGAQPCTNRAHRAQPAREHRDTPRPAVAHRAALRASPRPSPLARPCCSYFALLVCTALAVGAALPPAHLSSSCCSPSPRGWAGQRRGGRLPRQAQAAGGSSRRWAGGRHDDGGGREGTGGRGRWRGGAQGARVGWERGRVRTARASEGA